VSQCEICQQAKVEHCKTPGLLQPLPIPLQAWHTVTIDFVERLPKSGGYDTIMVVVDKFSKFAKFIPLTHPFTAYIVALVFIQHVYDVFSMPQVIISDRDRIFTSQLWSYLFTKSRAKFHMSSAYHPQSDGQTERVNHCLEIFLRCFIQSSPSKWSDWLYLAEFWYNSSYHSAVQTTPFEILYGYGPTHFGFTMDDCAVSELEGWLRDMHFMHK
jgi:transposase InsO family protein